MGSEFDIHTGGIDHIPVHHENEIAQSIAANKKIPARFWLHGAFLAINNKRMGKSEGNLLTLPGLEKKGFSPIDFRFMCLRNHYRSLINFDITKMAEAKTALSFLRFSISRMTSGESKKIIAESSTLARKIRSTKKWITDSFFDDLNTSQAIDVIFEFTHYLNKLKTKKLAGAAEIKHALSEIYDYVDKVLAVGLTQNIAGQKVPKEILQLAKKRVKARQKSDFARADQIRKKISAKGYIIEDEVDGKGYKIIIK